MDTLHILNGECLRDYLEDYLKGQEISCFNECMADGKVTEQVFSKEFFHLRAKELTSYYRINSEDYLEKTESQLEKLLTKTYEKIILWFDYDMFCQINMLTVLAYLDQANFKGKVEIYLIQDEYWKCEEVKDIISEIKSVGLNGNFNKLYQAVLLGGQPLSVDDEYYTQSITQLPPLAEGIRLYRAYQQEENELTDFIKAHQKLEENILVGELLKRFRVYGLGDIQYCNLIKKCR